MMDLSIISETLDSINNFEFGFINGVIVFKMLDSINFNKMMLIVKLSVFDDKITTKSIQ